MLTLGMPNSSWKMSATITSYSLRGSKCSGVGKWLCGACQVCAAAVSSSFTPSQKRPLSNG